MNPYNIIRTVLIGLSLFMISCQTAKQEKARLENYPLHKLYNEGLANLKTHRFTSAARYFDEIERQYPTSPYAAIGQVLAAYSQYQDVGRVENNYFLAIETIETFLALHPHHPASEYMHYLLVRCYMDQLSSTKRDEKTAGEALKATKQLLEKFPSGQYMATVQARQNWLLSHIDGKTMAVARLCEKQGAYPAALRRFGEIARSDRSTQAAEAIYRIAEIYMILGLHADAQRILDTLKKKHSHTYWAQRASESLLKQRRQR